MITPTLHMNGSSATELLRVNLNARQAIADAIERLQQASPNARDFYVQGEDAFLQAAREHKSRYARLREIHDEINEIVVSVSDKIDQQGKARP